MIQPAQEPPKKSRGHLSGPLAGTAAMFSVTVGVIRWFYYGSTGSGADHAPTIVVSLLFGAIVLIGLAVAWLRYFKTRRDHRNRRKPINLA